MDLRAAIWDERVDAWMRLKYFGALADRYRARAAIAEVLSALLSAGAVASWFAAHAPGVAAFLSLASAAASIVVTATKWPEKRANAAAAQRHWTRRARAWDALWIEIHSRSDALTLARYQMERALDADGDDPDIDEDGALLSRAQTAAHRSLGIA